MKTIFIFIFGLFFLQSTAQNTKNMKETLLPYHFPTKYLQLKEGEIAYSKEGKSKKVLVFLHGLSSNSDAWYRNIETLKKDFTCIAIDLPGYGKSYKNAEEFTPTYFAEIVKEFTDQLKIKKFTLVGHSMGGQTALKFAAKYPESLEKLILIAPAGIEKFSDFEGNAMKMVVNSKAIMATTDDQIDKNYQLNFFKMPKEADQMILDRKNIVKSADFELHTLAIEKSVKGMIDDKVSDDLAKIKTPTLFIFGKNDALIPNKYLHPLLSIDELTKSAKASINNSKLVVIDEVGHFLQFEKPAETNKAILEFLSCK
jgi:pimeloyl-ACP methyl ester carboxylesterase